MERVGHSSDAEGITSSTIAEWVVQSVLKQPWQVVQRASQWMTYTVHGVAGLAHFVFADGSVLLTREWGKTTLAFDPFDPESWRGYCVHMELWGLLDYVVTAPGADVLAQLASEPPCPRLCTPSQAGECRLLAVTR